MRTIIIVEHDGDFDPEAAAEAVGELAGVDDVNATTEFSVVAVGNPFEGVTLTGPFTDAETADEWADTGGAPSGDWWLVDVTVLQD